jgi:microcystin-dependent protein
MLPTEWTRMAIAFAVAVFAMSYLAIDAGVVSTSVVTKRIEVAQASIANVAASQHELAFAVQAWARRGHQQPHSEEQKFHLEECLAID